MWTFRQTWKENSVKFTNNSALLNHEWEEEKWLIGAQNWSWIDIKENITLILVMLCYKNENVHSNLRNREYDTILSNFLFCLCIHIKLAIN